MGLSGSKSTQTYTPSPQQAQAASTLTSAYNAAQPYTDQIASTLRGIVPGMATQVGAANQNLGAASNYYGSVLNGSYLGSGNPYLSGQLNATDNAIRDQVNGSFSAAGRYGSGANAYALAKGIGENENALRYQDYSAERQRMADAASGASNLDAQTLGSLLGLSTTAAGLPLQQASQYASGIGSLGIGGTTTSTQSLGLGSILGGVLGSGLAGWASGGFKGV